MSPRDRALRLLAGTTASGRAFLEVAAEALALGLGCPWAGFGRALDGENAEALVLWNRDRLSEGFRYALAGSPCAVSYDRGQVEPYWFCPEGVCRRFSGPPILFAIKAESYRSEAILDSGGHLVGHVFAISDRPQQDDAESRDFFRLVARRAGVEYERLLAEQALQRSEARNRSIVEDLPDLVCRFLPDATLTYVNETYCRFFGLRREELLGNSFFEWVPEEERELLWSNMRSITRDNPQSSYENRFTLPTGELRWLRWTDCGLFDEEGRLIEFYSVGRDVTEEKLALDALRASEALVRSTTDMVPALVSHVGPDLRYRFVNRAYEDWFGIPRDHVLGKRVSDVMFSASFARIRSHLERALAGEVVHFETVLTTKDDKPRHVRVQYQPCRTDDGEPDGLVALVQDISDLVHAAQELQKAKETAERINTAKSRFLAAANHDLRQPLHALRLLLAALSCAPGEERRAEIVAKMKLGLESMASMLDALLDVSELEAGTVTPDIVEFPVDDLFRLAASSQGPRAKAKGLEFRFVPCRASLCSDPALLARIIENFLSNAVRYTERGKVLLGCRRCGDSLRLEVWDSGIGIPQSQFGEIFKEFHQLDNPARDRSKGLGLGLAIASRMAEVLGHPIDVRSRLGQGSMFAVTVPLGRSRYLPAALAAPLETGRSLHGVTILVIDNEIEVLEATRGLLADWGAKVATAGSCADAVKAARKLWPDLLVADYRLPGQTSGIDAIKAVSALAGAPLPAVLVTGDTAPEQLKKIEASGYPVLIKPVGAERLRAVIGALLDARVSAA